MRIIISMLLSSAILLLAFLVAEHFMGDRLSQRYKYFILKIAMVFLMVPFGSIKAFISTSITQYFPSIPRSSIVGKTITGGMRILAITPSKLYVSDGYRITLWLMALWLAAFMAMLIVSLRKQVVFRKQIQGSLRESSAPELQELLKKQMQVLKIHKTVRLYITDINLSPFTFGLLKPIIVMPNLPDADKQELILKHELYHIKKHDNIVKLFQRIIMEIWCFNPFVYVLNSYLNRFCELACDEWVANTLDKDDRKGYASLIVDLASLNDSQKSLYISPFSNGKETYKERIITIMKNRKITKRVCLLTTGMLLLSAIPALAYPDPIIEKYDEVVPRSSMMLGFSDSSTFRLGDIHDSVAYKEIQFDNQFTDADGNIYEIIPSNSDKKAACQHTYIDGIQDKHRRNPDGSCITKTYNAKRCTKCNNVVTGSLKTEYKCVQCPH